MIMFVLSGQSTTSLTITMNIVLGHPCCEVGLSWKHHGWVVAFVCPKRMKEKGHACSC